VTSRDQEALEKMRSTFGRLEQYGERLREHVYPEPGSPLAADDDAIPRPMRLSQHVWTALGAGYDHLSCVAMTIQNERVFTTATGTLSRAALMASAHALWLLMPDDVVERRRHLRAYSKEWLWRRAEWQRSVIPNLPAERQAATLEQAEMLDRDRAAVIAYDANPLPGMRPTDVIDAAARYTFTDENVIRSVNSEWARLSGDAHALGWSLMVQDTEWGPREDDGTHQVRATGSLDRLGNAYLGAWQIYEKAWARLWELGHAPTPDAS
jgi:hypothetical protein